MEEDRFKEQQPELFQVSVANKQRLVGRILAYILILLTTATLHAQDPWEQSMANDICDCMQGVTATNARNKADNCLVSVTSDYNQEMHQYYDLNASDNRDRRKMARHLAQLLAETCPILTTFKPQIHVKRRWSDGHPTSSDAFRSAKNPPPADSRDHISGEVNYPKHCSGRLEARPSPKTWHLRSDALKKTILLTFPRKKANLAIGDSIGVWYTRRWNPRTDIIENVVVKIEQMP